MLVREIMTMEPATVTPDTGVKAALRRLAELGITSMPVVDGQHRLLGIVSEVDLIREAVTRDPRAPEGSVVVDSLYPARYVREVYTRAVATVHAQDDVASAVELMSSTGAKSLPVLDDQGGLEGVISRSDIVLALARDDAEIAADLDDLLARLGHGDWLVEVHEGVVEVAGPSGPGEVSLAHVAARTVSGVTEVHVD